MVRVKLKTYLVAFSLCLPFVACSQTPAEHLVQLFSHWQRLQANFVQTIKDEKRDTINAEFSGHLAIEKPGRFRWFVKEPNQQLLIINDKKLWIYDVDLEQVTIRKLTPTDQATPAAFLSSDLSEITKQFIIKALPTISGKTRFALQPRASDQLYTQIELIFNRRAVLDALRFNDHLGQSTTITLSDVLLNQPIASSEFQLTIPKGVDVYQE